MNILHILHYKTTVDDHSNKLGLSVAGLVGIIAISLFTMMPIPKAEREEVVKREMVRRRKETPGERIRKHKRGLKLYKAPEQVIRARRKIRQMQEANYQYTITLN